jgi:hypothetical protein
MGKEGMAARLQANQTGRLRTSQTRGKRGAPEAVAAEDDELVLGALNLVVGDLRHRRERP